MNKILFDLEVTQPNQSGKRHGGGRYGEIVLSRIVQRGLPVTVYYDSKKWLNPEIINLLKYNQIKLIDISNNNIDEVINNNDIDCIYTPLLSARTESIKTCKVLATIHGLRSLELPVDLMQLKYKCERNLRSILLNYLLSLFPKLREHFIHKMIQNTSFIENNIDFVTVSTHSAYSIKTFFPQLTFDLEKIFYSPSIVQEKQLIRKYSSRYFLLVSANRWEKNNLRAIIALDRLFSRGLLTEYEVFVTGALSASEYTYKIKNSAKFKFLGYVDDDELTQLYNDAYCFIYPSLNEGFGYPPLEAMSKGVPVIASSFSSIFEVCQSAVIYANPFSIEEIMNRILIMTNDYIWEDFSNRGKHRFLEVKKRQDADLDRLIDYIYDISK